MSQVEKLSSISSIQCLPTCNISNYACPHVPLSLYHKREIVREKGEGRKDTANHKDYVHDECRHERPEAQYSSESNLNESSS